MGRARREREEDREREREEREEREEGRKEGKGEERRGEERKVERLERVEREGFERKSSRFSKSAENKWDLVKNQGPSQVDCHYPIPGYLIRLDSYTSSSVYRE